MFSLDLVEDLPKVKRVNVNGKRHYVRDGGEIITPYPSVTTVLSSEKESKKALHEWRKRVGAETANKISRQASSRGTSVHQMIEDYVLGVEHKNEIMPINYEMFLKLKEVADDRIGIIRLVEGQMLSDHLRVAGTVDMIAEFDGVMSVIDWKTAAREKSKSRCKNYFLQESAYAVMFEENTGIPVSQLVTVITNQEGTCQVFVEKRDDWIDKFIELRNQYELEQENDMEL
jgi:genome maintenance exonuclease 1